MDTEDKIARQRSPSLTTIKRRGEFLRPDPDIANGPGSGRLARFRAILHAVLLAALGLPMAIGGIMLLMLGGSFYYLLAGVHLMTIPDSPR